MTERDYTIDWFRPSDAESVARLFREVYGEGYPVKIVYDPREFARAVAKRDYVPVVARTPEGAVAGFLSFYRAAPNQKLYEMGLGMVSTGYRRSSILGLLMRRLMKAAFTSPGFEAIFGEAVCNHVLTQKAMVVFRTVETAIEVDLMPSEAYEEEESAAGRVSTVVSTRTLVPRPHTIYIPEIYDDYLTYMYGTFDDSRTFKRSEEALPSDRSTALTTQIFEGAAVARISVNEAGSDFAAILDSKEGDARRKGVAVTQIWLNLSRPWIGMCVEMMRSRGYFFCGIFPRWFGDDGLLMEKIEGRPNWEGIYLYSDRAKQILRFIKHDWESTQRG